MANIKNVTSVVLLIILLASCASVQNQDTILVGAILPLTGPGAGVGETFRAGLQWKADQLNAQGTPIELIIEDSQSDPKQSVTAFTYLTQTKDVDLIITTLSGVGLALKPLAEEQGILLWADISHPAMTENSSFVVRHANIASSDANTLFDKVREDGHLSVGLLYQNDDIGNAFRETAKKISKDQILIAEPVDAKSADFRSNIAKLLAHNPTAIVIYVLGPGAGITINQLRESGYTGQIYSSQGLTLSPGAVDLAKANLPGTYYLTYEENTDFTKAYNEKFGKNPPLIGVIGYTDLELLNYAIEQTNSQDPKTIVDFIKGLKTFKGTYETVEITPQGDILIQTVVKKWE